MSDAEKIPILPLSGERALSLSKKLRFLGKRLEPTVPGLKKKLHQAEIDIKPEIYVSLSLFVGMFYGVFIGGITVLATYLLTGTIGILSPFLGVLFFSMFYLYLIMYPTIEAKRRVGDIEKNLLFSLRHLLIEVRSGVPLFDAMVGISEGYGEVSDEFKKIVREINAGKDQKEALNRAVKRNPSLFFRRAIWQVVNALQGGSDVAQALEAITNNFADRQIDQIKRYGQRLNPWTMIYMIIAVILPSLGITFLIVLTSFTGLSIPVIVFPVIVVGLAVFQVFFIGFLKSQRPSLAF